MATVKEKNKIAIFFLESGLSTWKMLRQRCACKRHTAEVDSCGVKQTKTVWPSGLRRWLKAPFRKGVGSNPTAVNVMVCGFSPAAAFAEQEGYARLAAWSATVSANARAQGGEGSMPPALPTQ